MSLFIVAENAILQSQHALQQAQGNNSFKVVDAVRDMFSVILKSAYLNNTSALDTSQNVTELSIE